MTRHSKNNTDGAVFTYHERNNIKHGSLHMRLPGTAVKEWDRCSLTLNQTSNPVITPHGVLYDKEAILRELLRQKKEIKARKAQMKIDEKRLRYQQEEEQQRELNKREREFQKRQEQVHTVNSNSNNTEGKRERESSASNFWLPGKSPPTDAETESSIKKRKKEGISMHSLCPITNSPLRAKDLLSIRLKTSSTEKDSSTPMKTYLCPVCEVILSNNTKPIALITGTVLCEKCIKRFVLKEEKDPVLDTSIDVETDIIPIHNQGTGFAGSAPEDVNSKELSVYRPSVR